MQGSPFFMPRVTKKQWCLQRGLNIFLDTSSLASSRMKAPFFAEYKRVVTNNQPLPLGYEVEVMCRLQFK